MKRFEVHWSKTYVTTGIEEIEAESAIEAEQEISDRIGNLEGSMDYLGDKDTIEAIEVFSENTCECCGQVLKDKEEQRDGVLVARKALALEEAGPIPPPSAIGDKYE